jgi:fibronectin-binding autotransporter adhesin
MISNRIVHRAGAIAALGLIFAAAVSPAQAAVDTWLGNTSVSFSNAANWLSGTTPASGDSLIFGAAGSSGATLADNLFTQGSYNISGITFNAGASAFTINNNTGGFTLTGPIADNATNLETINDNFALSGNQTVGPTLAAGSLTVGGLISGGGSLTMNGPGLLTLNNFNTYTGGTVVNGGTLTLNNGGGTGVIRTNLVVNPGGFVNLSASGGDALGYNGGVCVPTVYVAGGIVNNTYNANESYITNWVLTGGTMESTGGGAYNYNTNFGITTVASTATSLINANSTATNLINLRGGAFPLTVASGTTASGVDLKITGVIFGGGPLNYSGGGLTLLTGNNTYTGATNISAGTLEFAPASGVSETLSGGFGGTPASPPAGVVVMAGSGGLLNLTGAGGFTGNIVISAGTLQVSRVSGGNNTTTSALGNTQVARTVTINSGGVIAWNAGNAVGGGGSNTTQLGYVINAGGLMTWTSAAPGTNNQLGAITLNGGTLATSQGFSAQYQSYELNGSVTVGGTIPSYIQLASNNTNTGNDGVNLGIDPAAGYQTTFNVGLTGSAGTATSNPDLTISVPLAIGGDNSQANVGFIKTGPGTMLITGGASASSFSGTATINQGIVSINNNNDLGANAAAVMLNGGQLTTTAGITNTHVFTIGASGGTINVNSTNTGSYQYYFNTQNALIGSGPLTVTGTGTLAASLGNIRIDHTNTYSGPITLQQGGIFEYGVAGAVAAGATFNIQNQGELSVQNNTALPNNITVNGGTNSVLSFENGNGGSFSGLITLNANAIIGMRDWYNNNTVRSGTISGQITGAAGLTVNSGLGAGGVLTLTNSTNNFQGGTTITNAEVQAITDTNFGQAPGIPTTNITLNNGTIYNDGANGLTTLNLATNRNITINGSGGFQPGWGPTGGITVNGQISGTGNLAVVWDGGVLLLNGSNSYTGNTTIGTVGPSYYNNTAATPTLRLGNANALPATTNVIFGVHPNDPGNTATLDLFGQSATIVGLSGGTNGIVNNSFGGTSTLTFNSNGSSTYSGVLENTNGLVALVMSGSGLQNLAGANNYGGGTTVSSGTLQLGSVTALGAATSSLSVNGGVLDLNGYSNTAGQFGGTGGQITSNAAGSPVLTVNNTMASTFSGSFVNGAAGSPGLTLAAGTLSLLGANTSNGPTAVTGGAVLQVGNGAILGGGTAGTALTVGSGTAGGTLVLGDGNGPAGTVRASSLAPAAPGAQGTIVGGNGSNSTLKVNYNGIVPDVFSGTIGGPGANQNNVALTVSGSGVLTLSGTHTYTGPTTVNAGVLNITGALGNTPVTVNSGALQGTGVIGGSVAVAISTSGASLNLAAANTANSLTVNGGLTLGGAGAYSANHSTLNYTLGAGGIETLNLNSSAVTLNSGGAYVNLSGVTSPGTYTLMDFGSQTGSGSFSLLAGSVAATKGAYPFTYTIHDTANSLTLNVVGPASPPVTYFTNANGSNLWNDISAYPTINWSSDSAGANPATFYPEGNTDVIFAAAANTALASTLGQNMTINSLNVNSVNSSTTIGADGHSLTILALADSNTSSDYPAAGSYGGNPAGSGIAIAAGAGPLTINTPVNLGNSQTWTNSSGSPFLVTGNIAGMAALASTQTLTLVNAGSGGTTLSGAISDGLNLGSLALMINSSGTGIVTLSGSNTYSGGTTLTAGSMALGNVNALGAGGLTVNGGQMDFGGFSVALPSLNGGGGTITNSGSAAMLTILSGGYAGTITDGAGTIALMKTTAGVLALTGTNNYSGGTTLGGGILQVSNSASLGASSGNLTFSGGTLQLLGNIASSRNYVVSANQNAAINTNGYSLTLSGNIGPSGTATNAGLSETGGGTLTLNGNNTFTGAATANNGVLNLNGSLVTNSPVLLALSANSVGVLNTSGSLNSFNVTLGNAVGAVGAVYQSGGSVTATAGANTAPSVWLGWVNGGFGYYNLSAGSLTSNETQIGAWGPNQNSGGNGLFEMSGGTLNNTGWITMTRSTGTLGQTGVLNMSGGLIHYAGGGLVANWGQFGTAIINVSGGTIATTGNQYISLNLTGNTTNTGILNLNGGLVVPNGVAGAGGIVNFNGGTLRASTGNGNFLNLSAAGSAYVYPGGAIIDDGGNAITISQALLAPTGSGVTTGGLTVSGSGYATPPIVTVSDSSGVGATAIAMINSSGSLTGIQITNPGVGYTNPTFTITGGGGTGSISGTDVLAANAATGGLTKNGSGTLALTASNSYGGPTAVNAGTLFATQPAALGTSWPSSGSVSVATGATLEVELNSVGNWSPANIDTLLSAASFANSSTLGINVPAAANSFTYGTDIGVGPSPFASNPNKNFLMAGPGQLVLNGTNSYTGNTTVTSGTLQFGDGVNGALAPTSGIVSGNGASALNNGTLAFNLPAATNVTAPIGGSGNLVQAGPSLLTLSAANTYGGSTMGTGGTLQLGVNNALPATTVATFNVGTLDLNGHVQSINQLIVNNSALNQSNGSLTVTGGQDGDVQIGGLAGSTGSYTMTGGALNVTAGPMDTGWYGNGTFTQSGGTVTAASYCIVGRQTGSTGSYAISGGLLQQTGAGQLLIIGEQGSGTLSVSGSGLVTAATRLQVGGGAGLGNGTVNLGAGVSGGTVQTNQVLGFAGGTSTVNFNGATLAAGAAPASPFLGGLTNAVVQTGGAVINSNGQTITSNQPLTGTPGDGGLTKTGAGTLVLLATNSYTGPTVVSAGTLQLGNLNGVVAEYNFGATALGSTAVNNLGSGGAAMNGTLIGTGAAIVAGGRNGANALQFTGNSVSNYMLVNNGITDLSGGGNWTVAGWIETSTPGATLFYKGDGANWSNGFSTFYVQNTNQLSGAIGAVRYAGGWVIGNQTNVDNGTWQFVTITDAGGTKNVYINGVNTGLNSNAFNNADTGSVVHIGASVAAQGDGEVPFNGLMDSLYFYSQALTPAAVQALYSGSGNLLPATTPVQIAPGAALDLAGISQQVASLSDSTRGNGGTVTNSAPIPSTLTLAPAGGSTTFSGTIQNGNGTVSLVFDGPGTQVLAGSNTYSGATTVNGGVLAAGAANALSPNSTVTINGGLLDVTAGSQSIAGLNISAGNLNLAIGDLLSVSGSASLGGVLALSGSYAGPSIELLGATSLSGSFASSNIAAYPGYVLDYNYAMNQVDLVSNGPPTSTWANSAGGNWTTASNWTPSVPNAQGAVAILGSNLLTSDTVTLDQPQTVGTLIFANSIASYALSGSTLTLDNTGGTAAGSQVLVQAGTHSIAAPLFLANGSLTVNGSNSGVLTISGNISDDGGIRSLTLNGDGTGQLILSGNNSYGGGTIVDAGTLVIDAATALPDGSSLIVGQGASSLFAPAAAWPAAAVPGADRDYTVSAAVPEPGTIALVLAGLVVGGHTVLRVGVRWRKTRNCS